MKSSRAPHAERQRAAAFLPVVTQLLGSGIGVRFRTSGWSMQPAIRGGESVTVVPIAPRDVKSGDIVLYRAAAARVVAHRVIEVGAGRNPAHLTLRGDAIASCDAPVHHGQLLGKVVAVERRGRWRQLDTRRARLEDACCRTLARVTSTARRALAPAWRQAEI